MDGIGARIVFNFCFPIPNVKTSLPFRTGVLW